MVFHCLDKNKIYSQQHNSTSRRIITTVHKFCCVKVLSYNVDSCRTDTLNNAAYRAPHNNAAISIEQHIKLLFSTFDVSFAVAIQIAYSNDVIKP